MPQNHTELLQSAKEKQKQQCTKVVWLFLWIIAQHRENYFDNVDVLGTCKHVSDDGLSI